MKCEKIQKLILTDYADGELDEKRRQEIAGHIAACESCRQLEEALKKQVIDPIRGTEHLEAPEELWERIKGAIKEPEGERTPQEIQEFLSNLFAARKPVLAVISLLVVLLVGGIFTRSYFTEKSAMNVYLEDQLDFLEGLTNGNGGADDNNGMWTEEFFL